MSQKKDYRILWRLLGKNLWKNKKKFFLFFSSSFLMVTSIFVLVLLRDMLQSFQSSVVRLSRGMYSVMIHGMMVVAIVTAISLMMSLRTYVASRRKDYELLRVLGTPVPIQNKLRLLEYVGSMLVSAVCGGLAGTVIVFALRYVLLHFFSYFGGMNVPGAASYFIASGINLVIFILCLLINNEVAVETNLMSANKNSFEKSTLLPDFTKWISAFGVLFVGVGMLVFLGLRDFGEGMLYIITFFVGMLILWIFGGGYFFRRKEKECIAHPEKMIRWNVFYHRYYSKGLKRFLLFVLSFFLLFYYALQIVGSIPIQLGEEEFPYEFLLKTREDDKQAKELIELIEREYQAETQMFPAVNVVTQRGDEFVADKYGNGYGGQNIGIAESTYQMLTGKQLGLTGENIYIVYQQISSDKAHPIDYANIDEPACHFGSGYRNTGYVDFFKMFHHYSVQGSERNILLGYWGKGYNENIVVFSDKYFERIKKEELQSDLNKKWMQSGRETDPRLNLDKPEQASDYSDSIVMIKAPKSSAAKIEELLRDYKESLPFERQVQYKYDATVKMYYNSNTVLRENMAERTLKLVTCSLQYVFILFVMLYLLYLNMNEDYELKKRLFEFLRCLGLSRKDAADAVLFESKFTAYVPFLMGSAFSLIYAVGIGNLRRYTGAEWRQYLISMGVMWGITLAAYFVIYWFMRRAIKKQIIA